METQTVESQIHNQITRVFSEEVTTLCTVDKICMMPVTQGTQFFIFMATLYIVTELNKPNNIQVFSPFLTNAELQSEVSSNPYSNTIEYDFIKSNDKDYERRDALAVIMHNITSSIARKAFCIVPITLTGHDSTHSNTLIIFKDIDRILKAIIVEPHGFKKAPYGDNSLYYEAIKSLLPSEIELLNNNAIFEVDRCQGLLQREVVFAIDNPDTDGLMITERMCTTLSALLTMKYINKISALGEDRIDIEEEKDFFSCSDIILQGYGGVTELNQAILFFGVTTMMQSQNVHYLRSGKSEHNQTNMLHRMFGGIFDLTQTTDEFGAEKLVRGALNNRAIGHKWLGKEYIKQLFTNECKMKITDKGLVDVTPVPHARKNGGYLKLKRKTKKNIKKRSNKKRYKKYSQHIKRKTKRTKRKSKQKDN